MHKMEEAAPASVCFSYWINIGVTLPVASHGKPCNLSCLCLCKMV